MVRRLALIAVALGVLGLAVWALWPRPMAVETDVIARRALAVTIEDEGQTRIRNVFTVSAPVAGRLSRPTLRPGDRVAYQQVIASIWPSDPVLLDARSRRVAEARVAAAEAAVNLAQAQIAQTEARRTFLEGELARTQQLAERGIVPERTLSQASLDAAVAASELESARATLLVRQRELESERAALIESNAEGGGATCCVEVRAPVSGEVLFVGAESEQVVQPGMVLMELGDPSDLEVVVDLLSRDAVTIAPGASATIEGWGGPPLEAVVSRIYPAAQTRVSALGIEEQRLTVVLDFRGDREAFSRLGHGFRVIVSIVQWQSQDCVAVPMSALFRHGEDWAVFVAEDGHARLRPVEIDQRNDSYARVVSGLEPGEAVILHPGDTIADGVTIALDPAA